MIRKKRILYLAIVLIAVVVLAIGGRLLKNQNGGANKIKSTNNTTASVSLNQDVVTEFRQLQTQEAQYDRTVWADEILAQQYEQVIIDLWDRMRATTNKFSVLSSVLFDELVYAASSSDIQHGHNIQEVTLSGELKILSPENWSELLAQFQRDGLIIEQTEWRQTRFENNVELGPKSVIAMTVHAFNPSRDRRYILTGDLEISWSLRPEPNQTPGIVTIRTENLILKSSPNRVAFKKVLSRILPSGTASESLEPVILVRDLDGDGLSEIILAGKNIVYRNRGNMHFESETFISGRNQLIFTGLIADFTQDGNADFLAADANGLLLWRGVEQGSFQDFPQRVWDVGEEPLFNVFGMTAGDIDADGDLDIWMGQYKKPYVGGQMPTPYYDANDSFPSYLLKNNGTGIFEDITSDSGISEKRFRRNYSGSFVDLDGDRDLDLVTLNDFAGIDLFFNDGRGNFNNVTNKMVDERHLFGMAHSFGDFNLDGQLDIFAVGMTSPFAERLDDMGLGRSDYPGYQQMRSAMSYGNRLYFGGNESFQMSPMSEDVRDAGWAWGSAAFDFDNDADLDLYVSNGHATRATAKDYDVDFWTHDIYVANSELNPAVNLYFRSKAQRNYDTGISHGGNYRNNFFINENNESFVEAAYLMGVAFPRDYRQAIAEDLDGDGKQDLVLTIYEDWPRLKQELEIYQNVSDDTGNWINFRFGENYLEKSPIGTTIRIESGGNEQMRQIVAGDSYRTQNSFTAHFGLGDSDAPVQGKIIWPDGTERIIQNLPVNSYYSFEP